MTDLADCAILFAPPDVDVAVDRVERVRPRLLPTATIWVSADADYIAGRPVGIAWRIAMALQQRDLVLRSDIILVRDPNANGVDRPAMAHSYLFMFSTSTRTTIWRSRDTNEWSTTPNLDERIAIAADGDDDQNRSRWRAFDYYYDAPAVAEPAVDPGRHRNDRIGGATGHLVRHSYGGMMGASETRNRRSVWAGPFPDCLAPAILAASPDGGTVIGPPAIADLVAANGRRFISA